MDRQGERADTEQGIHAVPLVAARWWRAGTVVVGPIPFGPFTVTLSYLLVRLMDPRNLKGNTHTIPTYLPLPEREPRDCWRFSVCTSSRESFHTR